MASLVDRSASFLKQAAIMGASTVVVGASLKGLYQTTGWERPATLTTPAREVPWPIWFFFTGAFVHAVWQATTGGKK